MKKINVGIVGITGLVGQTIKEILEKTNLPIERLFVYASERSKGETVEFKDETIIIKAFSETSLNDPIDVLFFAVESQLALKYAPLAAQKGIYIIDNSSAFRLDPNIPLVVPEVNQNQLTKDSYLIANPNCSTIQSVTALSKIHELFTLTDVNFTTYQAVSGSGVAGIRDLKTTSEGKKPEFYPKPIYDNVIPQIDAFLDNGYTKEEMKMVDETQKILNTKLKITATTVRVPVRVGHSVQIHATTKEVIDYDKLVQAYQKSEHIVLYSNHSYPTPLDVVGDNLVHIGRLRLDLNYPNKLLLWTVADNVRKGAALNAVQIAQIIYKEFIL